MADIDFRIRMGYTNEEVGKYFSLTDKEKQPPDDFAYKFQRGEIAGETAAGEKHWTNPVARREGIGLLHTTTMKAQLPKGYPYSRGNLSPIRGGRQWI